MTTHLWKQASTMEEILPRLQQLLEKKVERMCRQLQDKSPHVATDGIYDHGRLDWWTSGFWPGLLWITHDLTGNQQFRDAAWRWDEQLEQKFAEPNNFHHDVGFQFLPTAVLKYKLTGDENGRRRGLTAANFLAGRFNPVGGFIRAWNQPERPGWSIIDTAMNLSLLFWAAEESGDPRYAHIGRAHADTIIRDFIRPDGSVHHIVVFDPHTGVRLHALGGQGAAPDSAWSRGAAWAIHGLACVHRYTGEQRYLDAARQVAHFFLSALPSDSIAHWDFRAADDLSDEPRDTSAAACAASGLLEVAEALPLREGAMYRQAAKRILLSLTRDYGTWDDERHEGILRGGTGNKPGGKNVNVSLIYGDYFYVEALAKLSDWKVRVF